MAHTDIDELLNSMRAENELNNEKFAKALVEINSKLEGITADGETAELVRDNILNLKVELENRHRYVMEKFDNVKNSFEVLNEKHDLITKNSDLKIMFNILNENIDHFAQEISEQKNKLEYLEANLADFRNDNSKKDEIIEKVSIVKEGIDEVNRGLQASIMEVNSSLRNITKTLMTMDVTDQNDIIKRELENIYIASKGIFSALEIIDQKNDDLAKNLLTKDDLSDVSSKIGGSITEISEKISALNFDEKIIAEIEANRNELKAFNESISNGLSGYLASVRTVLRECVDDITKAQASALENNEADADLKLEAFKKLSSEILSVEESLLSANQNSMSLINTRLTDLEDVVENFRSFIDSNHIALETELVSKICGLEMVIQQCPTVILEKFDKWQEVIDKSIESVGDVASKNNLKLGEALASIAGLKSELISLSEGISTAGFANNGLISSLEDKITNDIGGFRENIEGLENKLSSLKTSVENSVVENKENLADILDETVEKIGLILAGLKDDNSLVELENIKSQVSAVSTKIEELNAEFMSITSLNVEKILTEIQTIASEQGQAIQKIADVLDHNFQYISKNIENSAFDNRQNFESIDAKFEATASANAKEITSKISALESKVDLLGVDISTDLDTTADTVKEFIEEYRGNSLKSSDEILTLTDSIKNLELELVTNSSKFNTALEDQLISLNGYVLTLKDLYEKNSDKKELAEFAQKMLAVETALHTLGESFTDDLSNIQTKVAEYSKAVADISLETKSKLSLSLEEIGSIKTEFANALEKSTIEDAQLSEKINDIANIIFSKLENLADNVIELKESNNSDLASLVQENLINIEDHFTELQGLFKSSVEKLITDTEDFSTSITGRIDDLKQEIGLINTDLSDIIANKSDAIVESFAPLKESIDSFLNSEMEKLVDDIKSQIELSYLNFSADVNESLTENHDSYVHLEEAYSVLIERFAKVHEVIVDLNENQIGMMCETIKELDKTQSDNFEKTNSLLVSWKEDLSELEEKFELSFSGVISSLTKGFEEQKAKAEFNKNEITSAISNLLTKDEFDGAVFVQTDELRNIISTGNEKTEAALDDIKSVVNEFEETSEEALDDIKSIVENINEKSDNFAQIKHTEKIEDLMKSLDEKVSILAQSGDVDAVQAMLAELHEKVDIIAMTDEESKFLDLEDIINALHEKVDVIAMTDESQHIEDLVQSLHEKVDIIAMTDESQHIEDLVQSLHEKVDIMAMTDESQHIEDLVHALHQKVDVIAATDDAELYNEIQNIKDLIDEQRKQIEAFGSEDSDLDKRLQSLSQEISNIDFEKSASDIKESVVSAVLGVTDQITFAQETEEIKGFVEERTEEINRNLLDVKKQLCSIASGSDVWDYSYTMQDIESDIAKLRLILNDISASSSKEDLNEISKNMHKLAASVNTLHSTLTEEQLHELRENVVKINEDVVSLSSRTNKLLLNSDESHKALTDGIGELNRVLSMFGSTAPGEVLQEKLDSINAAIANSADTDNVMREVMLYLGEWIDDASEKIDTIVADTANLSSINSELCYLKTMMGNSDIIESIRQKFEVQQKRIDTLESKLDRVMELLENQNLEKKMDMVDDRLRVLDSRIGKLTDGIEKLASYVDEE